MIMFGRLFERLFEFLFIEGSNQGFIARFAASFFGSFLFHLAIIVFRFAATDFTFPNIFLEYALIQVILLSVIFGLTISAGYKTGLIQGFLWGVFLPWICYFLASILIYSNSQSISIIT